MDLHGLQQDSCLTMGCTMGSSAWSISSPSSTDLGVSRVVPLTYSHSSLPAAVFAGFFSLLGHVIPEALPPSLMGSALASRGFILELSGIGSIGYGGSFCHVLTEAMAVAPDSSTPATTKTLPSKSNRD
ncbi:hypothetical protein BTVI_41283 [Pitangus sulphuratus]|nr:hypothetical protein BTVI_41283 [Pitangus sulphuratus]